MAKDEERRKGSELDESNIEEDEAASTASSNASNEKESVEEGEDYKSAEKWTDKINKVSKVSDKVFDPFIKVIEKQVSSSRIDAAQRSAESLGHVMIPLLILITVLFSLIVAIKSDSVRLFLGGMGICFILLLGQYISARFLRSLRSLIKVSEGQIASENLLRCFALLSAMSGIGLFIAGVVSAINTEQLSPLLVSSTLGLLLLFLAGLALNPKTVNVVVNEHATPGQEAVGLIGFFFKAFLALIPIFYGVALFLAFLGTSYGGIIASFGDGFEAMGGMALATTSITLAASAALLPFFAYIIYLLYYLVIDIIQAILVVPHRLETIIAKVGK